MPNHTIFCTYFDKNYLPKGLALHASLTRFTPHAILWILCFDSYTKKLLDKLKLPGVTTISLKQFEDRWLRLAKRNRSRIEYYWTCTPSLPLYVFKNNPRAQRVVYLDADQYFFSELSPVFHELGKGSIYTVESRYPPGQEFRNLTTGRFNVAFQIFRRDGHGLTCLKRWRRQCLKWCYWREEEGKLADQMYLNEWPQLYPNLIISQNIGVNVAPWNVGQYQVSQKGHRVYINDTPLVCYHFHQFEVLSTSFVQLSIGYKLSKDLKELVYKPYISEIKNQIQTIKYVDPSFQIPFHVSPKKLLWKFVIDTIGPIYWRLRSTRRYWS